MHFIHCALKKRKKKERRSITRCRSLIPPRFSPSLSPSTCTILTKSISTYTCHHDEENQETHTPTTMPCTWTRYGDPLPRPCINIGGTTNREGRCGRTEKK